MQARGVPVSALEAVRRRQLASSALVKLQRGGALAVSGRWGGLLAATRCDSCAMADASMQS